MAVLAAIRGPGFDSFVYRPETEFEAFFPAKGIEIDARLLLPLESGTAGWPEAMRIMGAQTAREFIASVAARVLAGEFILALEI